MITITIYSGIGVSSKKQSLVETHFVKIFTELFFENNDIKFVWKDIKNTIKLKEVSIEINIENFLIEQAVLQNISDRTLIFLFYTTLIEIKSGTPLKVRIIPKSGDVICINETR